MVYTWFHLFHNNPYLIFWGYVQKCIIFQVLHYFTIWFTSLVNKYRKLNFPRSLTVYVRYKNEKKYYPCTNWDCIGIGSKTSTLLCYICIKGTVGGWCALPLQHKADWPVRALLAATDKHSLRPPITHVKLSSYLEQFPLPCSSLQSSACVRNFQMRLQPSQDLVANSTGHLHRVKFLMHTTAQAAHHQLPSVFKLPSVFT